VANLLYRLGRFSGRRPWVVIVGWIVALGLAGGGFLAFGGTLATSFSIPGTETQRVNDQLSAALPDLKGLSATVVFQADDGAFTDAQKTAIGDLLTQIGGLDGIVGTTDPFDTQTQRDQQAQQLADGQAQIDAARAQLATSAQQLDAGQQQLDAAVAQAKAAGVYDAAAASFQAQQAQLDAGRTQLRDATAQLDAKAAELSDGKVLLDASSAIRTVSEDGATAVGVVSFQDDLFTLSPEVKDAVKAALDDARIDGVTVAYSSDIATSTDGIVGPGEIAGLLVAVIVLIVMLRALLPALIPLLSSLIGVGVGVAGSLAFSGLVDMSSITPVLGVMLGLAVGIDYSLFILNRHRTQLLAGVETQESIGLAVGTSGNAVVFAGSTVLVALLALNITGVPFLGVMGTVGAACVLVAVLVAISFTPALLGLRGMRVLSRRARARVGHPEHVGKEIRPMSTGRALGAVAIAVIGLLVIAIPALTMRLGLPDGSSEAPDTAGYRAYEITSEAFGAGVNGPLLVVATLPAPVAEDAVTATEVPIVQQLMAQDGVVAVAPVATSPDRDVIAFQVVPQDGPSSESTQRLVQDLRGLSPLEGGIALGVAGQASGNIDVSQKLADALPLYLAVVIGLSLIIMIVVFRSLLVPVIATAGFVLSLFATFGAMTAIFQWGWLGGVFGVTNPGPILSFAPIIIMGVLFGLAMDYQLFLVSGMREAYVHGSPARTAVVAGVRHGRAVVTAAAIIMISVFGGFVFSHLAMIRPLGFGLAIGVLFDAFVVRMLLVPGLMHLFGRAAWWLPKRLDRIIPNVDVEGAALERAHHVG
jgi:putative drug exporter of the RND superfamily